MGDYVFVQRYSGGFFFSIFGANKPNIARVRASETMGDYVFVQRYSGGFFAFVGANNPKLARVRANETR